MRRPALSRPLCFMFTVACGLSAPGCLISQPPDVEQQEQVPPRINYKTIDPDLTTITQTDTSTGAPVFQVSYFSEDLGERTEGRLFLNYGQASQRRLSNSTRPASTIDNETTMTLQWLDGQLQAAGCYIITMTIAHQSNYPSADDDMGVAAQQGPIDLEKTAIVNWTVAHRISPDLIDLSDCPNAGELITN